jgi:hypothetical protein
MDRSDLRLALVVIILVILFWGSPDVHDHLRGCVVDGKLVCEEEE